MSNEQGFSRIVPSWPAPDNIVAFTSCRHGGVSEAPFDSFNLAMHVGDQPELVARNRQQLLSACPALDQIQWLQQSHSNRCIQANADCLDVSPNADAAITDQQGLACAVMTADCLPLLLCDNQGRQVAAVHAGWRGLLTGVIEQTVAQFKVPPPQLLVWLGPAISQNHFEVGDEVRQQFLDHSTVEQRQATTAAFTSGKSGKWLADLYQLARIRLAALAVDKIYGGEHCSFAEPSQFYSYRRDGETGRMVSLIYRRP